MYISGGTNDSTILHALEPLFKRLGGTTMTYMGVADQPASSFAHDLIELWLVSALGDADELRKAYLRCGRVLNTLDIWGPELR